MTTLASDTIKDPSWYTKEGEPMVGDVRKARKFGWLPSVTSIIKMWPNFGLSVYKRKQDALAFATTPRAAHWTDDEWIEQCIKSADEHAKGARGFGSDLAECRAAGKCLYPYLQPWWDALPKSNERILEREKVVVNKRYGYAGRFDEWSTGVTGPYWLSDDKCREKPKTYDTDIMQLAAYLDCFPINYWSATKCRSRIINRLTPEPPMIREWTLDEVREGFERFLACLKMFKLFHNL